MEHCEPTHAPSDKEIAILPGQPLPPLQPRKKPTPLQAPPRGWVEFERPMHSAPTPPETPQKWQTKISQWQLASRKRASSELFGERSSSESGVLPASQRPALEHIHESPPVLPAIPTLPVLPFRATPPPVGPSNQPGKLAYLTGHDLDFPDDIRAQTITILDDTSSLSSIDHPLSEPARTLGIFEAETAPCPLRPPWTPASPVPASLQLEQGRHHRQSESFLAGQKSPSLHHFETIPARRSNHNEHSVDGARDLYHATATQIAALTQVVDGPAVEPLSFAANVTQTGRKGVPGRVETKVAGTLGTPSYDPAKSWFETDDGKSPKKTKYSDTFSRVLRRSGELWSPGWAKQGDWGLIGRGSSTGPVISMRTRRASGPDTPRPLFSSHSESGSGSGSTPGGSPGLLHKINGQWHELLAQAKRTAGEAGIGMSKEERRREELRAKIRVVPGLVQL
ncbi:hypothetical protein ACHAQA_002833 [Verticillium albo-atrum]